MLGFVSAAGVGIVVCVNMFFLVTGGGSFVTGSWVILRVCLIMLIFIFFILRANEKTCETLYPAL